MVFVKFYTIFVTYNTFICLKLLDLFAYGSYKTIHIFRKKAYSSLKVYSLSWALNNEWQSINTKMQV